MNRPTYWAWTAGLLVFSFAWGFTFPNSLGMLNGFGMIYMWIVGAQRMNDTKHSQAWAIFAPFLIGMIWIGCLPSSVKETAHERV